MKNNYPSLQAFYAAIITASARNEYRPADWIGATPAQIETRRYSWPEGVRQLNQLPELHQTTAHTKRAKRWTETDGDTMSPERYQDGRPFMQQRYRADQGPKRGGHVQKIRINVAENCHTEADEMIWKTYAAARLVDQIESAGHRCEVVLVCCVKECYKKGRDTNYHLEITLKRPEQPLNLAAIITAASPWTFRRHILDHIRSLRPDIADGTGKADRMPPEPGALDIDRGECLSKAAAEAWIKKQTI